MNRFASVTRPLMWLTALLFAALTAGCGGGGGGSPILGGGGAGGGTGGGGGGGGLVVVTPGSGSCVAAAGNPLIPQVLSSNPTSGNLLASTSTTGSAGKLITATFSLPMAPATINAVATTAASTFSLKETLSGINVPGTVTMNATNVANTIATLATPAPLTAGLSYTATITTAATTPGAPGVALACTYQWSFTTVSPGAPGLAAIDMGLAAPFGISATAGLATNAGVSTINGNVLLEPGSFCNGAANPVDAFGGIGSCGGTFVPIIHGTVISHLFNPGGNLATIITDLNQLYLNIAPIVPPAGQPVGMLGGGIPIVAPTTLGTLGGGGAVSFTPGVYVSGASIGITGDLTLDAQGNADAVFVFQAGSTLTTAVGSRILLVNGAKASNVWWQVGSSATINGGTQFQGNIVSTATITFDAGSVSCGRMLAAAWTGGGGAAITVNGPLTVVSVPGSPSAPPGCI
jgi:hypothetical protein